MNKNIVFLNKENRPLQIKHGYIKTSGSSDAIKLFFRPRGSSTTCVSYVKQLFRFFENYLNTKGFVLEDGGSQIPRKYNLSKVNQNKRLKKHNY